MKKQIILLPLWLLTFINVNFSQQLENWAITSKFIDFNPTFTVSNLPTPTPPNTYTGAKAAYSQGSYHDPVGNLMFFIVDGKIYDNAGYYIGDFGTGLNTEVIAIPANEESYCGDYYLFYGSSNISSRVYWRLLQMDLQNPNFPSDPTKKGVLSGSNYINISANGGCSSLMLGITPKVTNGDRYLYAANCSHLNKILIQSNGTFTFQNGWLMPNNYTNHGLRSELEIIKLQDNTYKIAVPYLYESPPPYITYHWEIAVFPLNASGNYTVGSATYWNNLSTSLTQLFKGFEFSPNGQYLYFTQTHSPYLKYIDLGSTLTYELKAQYAPSSIPNSSEFKDGQIELGFDNKLYYVANNRLASLANPNNPVSSTWTNSVSGTQLTSNFYSLTYGQYSPGNPDYGLRLLLDQIDGQDYTYEFNNNCCEDITQWHEITETLSSSPTTQMWTVGSGNPYNANVIRIKSSLTIPSGVTLTIRSMTVEFGAGATINVGNGAHLKLENATLQTNCPKTMWQGIVVTGTGNVTMTNYGFLASSAIYDAIIGINLSGTSAKATVNNLSYFERNETHVKINTGGTQNSFIGSVFSHQVPLKDQTKGKDQSGGTAGTRYGINSFDLVNCTNTQIIGGTPSGYGNWFYEGQNGIYAVNSNVTSFRNIFNTVRNRGIFADGQWATGGRNLNVTTTNVFNNCKTAIDGHFGINLTVQSDTFKYGTEHAITWAYNPGRTLIIGSETNSALGNTFKGQNWSSVLATDNANSATSISIGYNVIQNAAWAGGIYVQESSGQTSQTYQNMHIVENDINDMGDGIVISNVWGINSLQQYDAQAGEPVPYSFKMNNNDIDFSTSYGSNKSGIRVSNSRFVRSRFNNVATTSNWTWGNKGIDYIDSRYSLVEKNYTKAAAGIQLTGDLLQSNIDCNDLDYCVVGIELSYEILRSLPTQHHGETNNLNRKNFFTNTASWGYDMDLYYSYPDQNKWVEPNTTAINYNPYTGNIIVSGGSSRCDQLPGYEMLMGGGGEEQQSYEGGQEDDFYWFESLPTEQEIWTIIYHDQSGHNAEQDGIIITDNPFITDVLNLEKLISENNFEQGREIWQQLSPVHSFEQNLKDVYSVILAYRPEEPRKLSEDEKTILIKVAQQNSWEAGPAVHSARAILKYKENIEFYDYVPGPILPYESGKTDETTTIVDMRFGAFPVPAKDILTLLSGIEGITYYKIVSIDGRIVETGSFTSRNDYNTQRLGAGSYYLEMADQAGNILYRKLISKQ